MDPQAALQALEEEPQTLTLLTLSSHLLNPDRRTSTNSDSSESNNPTPALLAADLAHYRDLFSKLRFSYVEQVTKERFLRSVTSDPPEFVDGAQNAELEGLLGEEKRQLKEKKDEVRELVKELEAQGRSLAERYNTITLQKAQLASLPAEIDNLQQTVVTLRAAQSPESSNPALSMPLQPTLAHLGEREAELSSIEQQIAALQATLPTKKQEVEGLQQDLGPLRMRKEEAIKEAQDARRRREEGGRGDELEEKGRWMRGVEKGLTSMLEV